MRGFSKLAAWLRTTYTEHLEVKALKKRRKKALHEFGWDFRCKCGKYGFADGHAKFAMEHENAWVYENACGCIVIFGLHGPHPLPIPEQCPEWRDRVVQAYADWKEQHREEANGLVTQVAA